MQKSYQRKGDGKNGIFYFIYTVCHSLRPLTFLGDILAFLKTYFKKVKIIVPYCTHCKVKNPGETEQQTLKTNVSVHQD
jgi:hypothetical protein